MIRVAAALALAAATARALTPPDSAPGPELARAVSRWEAALASSPAARRLLASARNVPRREQRRAASPDAISVSGWARPKIVLDPERALALPPHEAEILYAAALARVRVAAPLPLVEAEQAAWTQALIVCAELAADDPAGFGKALSRAAKEEGERAELLRALRRGSDEPFAPERAPALRLPESALRRAGLFLHMFERSPADFHWAVEALVARPAAALRLTELEDLFALRSAELAAMTDPPDGPYAELGGRRYPGPLARAAYVLRGTGDVERVREALDDYADSGAAALAGAVGRFRRAQR